MPRLPIPSSSRSRSASTRSASTIPRSSASTWPMDFLNSQGSPSTDGSHAAASTGKGSPRVPSSDGDNSPGHVNGNQDGGDGLYEAFHQANSEADNT